MTKYYIDFFLLQKFFNINVSKIFNFIRFMFNKRINKIYLKFTLNFFLFINSLLLYLNCLYIVKIAFDSFTLKKMQFYILLTLLHYKFVDSQHKS